MVPAVTLTVAAPRAAKNAARHRGRRARHAWNIRWFNGMDDGFPIGGRQQGDLAEQADKRLSGTTSIFEVVPQVVLCCWWIRRRQPGERGGGTGARARRTQHVRALVLPRR